MIYNDTIAGFFGEYRFLSNFYPCEISFNGFLFTSVEHAYVASKTTNMYAQMNIAAISTPGQAKRYGKTIELRKDWDDVKLDFMKDFVTQKFSTPDLKAKLMSTGDSELIELNTWGDTFWGQCPINVGHNYLGKLIMEVRKNNDSN